MIQLIERFQEVSAGSRPYARQSFTHSRRRTPSWFGSPHDAVVRAGGPPCRKPPGVGRPFRFGRHRFPFVMVPAPFGVGMLN